MEANEIKQNFPQDFQDLPDNDLIGYFFGSRQGDLKNFRISAKKVADSLGIVSLGGAPIYFDGNQLPSLNNTDDPVQKGDWVNLTPGQTYLNINGGPDIETPVGRWSIGAFDGSTWSLKDMGALPLQPLTSILSDSTDEAMTPLGVKSAIEIFAVVPEDTDFTLYGGDGTYSESGTARTSANWICTTPISIDPIGGDEVFIKNIQSSTGKRVLYYTAADTLHQSPLIVPIPDGVIDYEFTTPAGYVEMLITPARGTGVSSQIPLYESSFKIFIGGQPKIKSDMIIDDIESDQIVGIENDISNLKNKPNYALYYGLGFPQYELGQNGDSFFDRSSKSLFNKKDGLWKRFLNSRFYPIKKPVDFTWDIGKRIMYQENGKSFIEGWKGLFNEKVKADYDRLTKYYVSPTGSNSNDGLTPQTPVLTVQYAHGTLGARNIILSPGFYGITNNARMNKIVDNNTTTDPFIVRCLDGIATMARVYLGSIYTWTANGACYQTARTNVINVVDNSYLDEKGNPLQPTKVNSIAECQSTPNSFYATPSIIYVHTFDSRVPDANIYLCFAETTGYTAGQNVPYVYMENVNVINQNPNTAFLFDNNASVQYDTKVYLKSCFAGYNSQGNAIGIDNIKEAILEGCSGAYLLRDGLNYHTSNLSLGYAPIKVLEIDCEAYELGTKWTGEYSSNASTMHEGGTILRVNTNGSKASGSVIADVNAGIQSLNISSEANDTVLNDGFRVEGAGSKGWYFGCVAYSDLPTATSIKAENGAEAFYDSKSVLLNQTSGNVSEI